MSPYEAMDYEAFEKKRIHFHLAIADLEHRRTALEARGDDVDAMLRELNTTWHLYAQAQQRAEAALEYHLQCLADQVDAEEELLICVRQGMEKWNASLENTSDLNPMERVRLWEEYQAWKRHIQEKVLQAAPAVVSSNFERIIREAQALLEG